MLPRGLTFLQRQLSRSSQIPPALITIRCSIKFMQKNILKPKKVRIDPVFKTRIINGELLRAFPYGSGYPLYLFYLYRTKKDAAAIPNAAFRFTYSKKVKQLLCAVFCSLIFNAFTKTCAEKTKRAVFCQRSERNKKRRN